MLSNFIGTSLQGADNSCEKNEDKKRHENLNKGDFISFTVDSRSKFQSRVDCKRHEVKMPSNSGK